MDIIERFLPPDSVRFIIPAALAVLGIFLYVIANSVLKRTIVKIRASVRDIVVPFEQLFAPFRALFVLIVFLMLQYFFPLPEDISRLVSHTLSIGLILVVAWLGMRIISVVNMFVLKRYEFQKADNLEARKVATHLDIIQKVLNVLIIVIAVSCVLMTFDAVRQVGMSLLASAGVAGIILGFAAQKSIATLIAGIQIAVTQPIRIDDVVIVDNEWGKIEAITLTYVVVRIWDQRRLIVPINRFIDHSFQNWTRTSADLIGTVYLYVDYSVPVDEVRRELERIVGEDSLWDKKVVQLQVTNATEKTLELRALVSAADSSDAWELRCMVREKLLNFLQQNYPESLPKVRVEGMK